MTKVPPKEPTPLSYDSQCHEILFNDAQGFVVLPTGPSANGGKPWLWYAPTFIGALPGERHRWIFERLLSRGVAICGVDVGESFGNRDGRAKFSAFYEYVVTQHNLDPKVCLLGQSRGGLMAYNWAAENPNRVQCVAAIYAVTDLRSWPGLDRASLAYGMTPEEMKAALAQHNPIDRLGPLAEAKVPLFHIHGDADTLVPQEAHCSELARRYTSLGGQIEVVTVPGGGHCEVPEFFECQEIVDFLLGQTGGRRVGS